MYLKFKSLHLENFMSYENSDITLDNGGFTMLQGYNNCTEDNARSNGSGKSTIWDALTWCLTGDTIKGCKDVTRRDSEGGTLVKLDFSVDMDRYTIIRTKNHFKYKTNLKIYVNEEDKSGKGIKDSEEILHTLLPDVTSSLLSSVIILGQGMPDKFTDNTPSGRKAVLEKLSKSDFMIEELKQTVATRGKELSKLLREYEDNVTRDTSARNVKEGYLHEAEKCLTELLTFDVDSANKELEFLMSERDRFVDEEADYCEQRRYTQNAIDGLNEELINIHNALQAQLDIDSEPYKATIEKFTAANNELKAEDRSLQREIKEKSNIKDICPTCGQKLPGVIKVDVTPLKNRCEEIACALNINASKITEATNAMRDLGNKAVEDQKSMTAQISADKATLTTTLSNIDKQINNLNAEAVKVNNEINSKSLTLQNHDSLVDKAKESISKYEEEIKSLETSVLYNSTKTEETQSHLAIIKKMDTFLQRDFRGRLLHNIITFINEKAKLYSLQVFETTDVEIAQDGNNISISYLGKEYSALSGGEKKKVDIIVQLALRELLCTYMSFSCNLFVLDEIFDSLDVTGCQKVTDLIINELKDAGSIFIVSHRQDLPIPSDHVVTVVKDAHGVSSIIDK